MLLDGTEATDGAEVDEAEAAVGEHEHVARVRIGVEEAELHDLVDGGGEELAGQRRPLLGVDRAASLTVTPSKRSCTRMRRVHSRRCTKGTRTPLSGPRLPAISAMASASRRKSSSARRLVPNCATSSPERSSRPNGVLRWARFGDQGQRRQVAVHQLVDPGPLDLRRRRPPP